MRYCTFLVVKGFNSTVLQMGEGVQHKLQRGALGQAIHCGIRVVVENTHATAAVKLLPTFLWCDEIEFENGHGKDIQELHDIPSWLSLRNYSPEQLKYISQATNTHLTTFKGLADLPAQTKRTYIIYLPNNFIQAMKLHPAALDEDLQLQLNFRLGGVIESGTGTPVVRSMDFIYWHAKPSEAAKLEVKNKFYRNLKSNIIQWERTKSGAPVAFAPNVETTLEFKSTRGNCVAVFVGLRASSAVAAGALIDFAQIGNANNDGTIQFYRNDTEEVFSQPISVFVNKLVENGANFSSELLLNTNGELICFSDPSVFHTYVIDGCLEMDRDISMRIKPGADFVAGNYEPLVYMAFVNQINVTNNTLSVTSSASFDARTLRVTIATSDPELSIRWATGPNARASAGKVLGFVNDSPAGLSHTSDVPPNLAQPQYSPNGVDSIGNRFDFCIPVTANSGGDCGQFIEYMPCGILQTKTLSNVNLVGLPTDLKVRVTTSEPGFTINREWSMLLMLE